MEEDQRWDGLHGVVTNLAQMEAEEVPLPRLVAGGGDLPRKHDLRVRPIFHCTGTHPGASGDSGPVCVRHLAYRVGLQSRRLSPEAIRTALLHPACWSIRARVGIMSFPPR